MLTADQRRQAVGDLGAVRRLGAPGVPGAGAAAFDPTAAADGPEGEERLVERMLELVRQHPRYGYRRIWALLRGEGWRVNRKRVHRLWRQQGLKVPQKQRKKRRLGRSANGCIRRRAEHRDHVWAWDFCTTGRPTAGR